MNHLITHLITHAAMLTLLTVFSCTPTAITEGPAHAHAPTRSWDADDVRVGALVSTSSLGLAGDVFLVSDFRITDGCTGPGHFTLTSATPTVHLSKLTPLLDCHPLLVSLTLKRGETTTIFLAQDGAGATVTAGLTIPPAATLFSSVPTGTDRLTDVWISGVSTVVVGGGTIVVSVSIREKITGSEVTVKSFTSASNCDVIDVAAGSTIVALCTEPSAIRYAVGTRSIPATADGSQTCPKATFAGISNVIVANVPVTPLAQGGYATCAITQEAGWSAGYQAECASVAVSSSTQTVDLSSQNATFSASLDYCYELAGNENPISRKSFVSTPAGFCGTVLQHGALDPDTGYSRWAHEQVTSCGYTLNSFTSSDDCYPSQKSFQFDDPDAFDNTMDPYADVVLSCSVSNMNYVSAHVDVDANNTGEGACQVGQYYDTNNITDNVVGTLQVNGSPTCTMHHPGGYPREYADEQNPICADTRHPPGDDIKTGGDITGSFDILFSTCQDYVAL